MAAPISGSASAGARGGRQSSGVTITTGGAGGGGLSMNTVIVGVLALGALWMLTRR